MTCLEAQSNIMAFIDKKLPEDKVNDFVRHIKNCQNCSEELEIYYTLIVGTRQLDNNEELSKDFDKDLKNELQRISNRVKKARRFRVSAFGICFVGLIGLFGFFYNSCLERVYNREQSIIKEAQGDMYFYDVFGGCIDLCKVDLEDKYYEEKNDEFLQSNLDKLTFYENIRKFNLENIEENIDE
jgi:hypothetical protein